MIDVKQACSSRMAVAIWLLAMAACAVAVSRVKLQTDMSAFLPRSAPAAQQALTDQVNKGAASHLVLLAIQGASPAMRAALSETLAVRLRRQSGFIDVANGDEASFAGVQDFVWRNRYLLSPGVTAERFSTAGLRGALQNDIGLLDSDMGGMLQTSLPADPTGELLTLTDRFLAGQGPEIRDGVWVSGDGGSALLLVHTAAAGFDIDATQRGLGLIQAAFDDARAGTPDAGGARLLETGPGVFAVHIRDTTKSDVTRLSMLASAGAVCLLLFAYRSPRVLVLGLLPVASGVLAAIAMVSLKFGFVHGVTLGFGVTLIGESIDYAIYLFTQTAPGEPAVGTLARIWPTLRLGAATSVVGFGAMLFSNFVGFAQLGLFSITGLITAAGVTRFVLPHLAPAGFAAPGSGALGRPLRAIIAHRRALRLPIAAAALAAGAALALHRGGLWDGSLDHLSPVPASEQALDRSLRADLGVADLRYFAVFSAPSEEQALRASEALTPALQALVDRQQLKTFDLPSQILPSERTQLQRQAALPDAATLQARFAQASAGLPFRPGLFAPFFAAVEAARTAPPLTPKTLPPALALQLQSLLIKSDSGWTVVAPLGVVADPATIAAALSAPGVPRTEFVDLDRESGQLLRVFQSDASKLAMIGSLAILAVLFAGLRAPARVAAIAAPLAAAVLVTAALLTLDGGKLSIFMVVGFLLIIAVGSNYCLFFERTAPDTPAGHRALGAILLANLCTVSAYGLMSFSRIPVLHDIGMTVATGTFLTLCFGAVLSPPASRP